jgi:hypothetical protein
MAGMARGEAKAKRWQWTLGGMLLMILGVACALAICIQFPDWIIVGFIVMGVAFGATFGRLRGRLRVFPEIYFGALLGCAAYILFALLWGFAGMLIWPMD